MARYLTAIIAALVMASCTFGYEGDDKTVVTEGMLFTFEAQQKIAQDHCAFYGREAVHVRRRYDKINHAHEWSCK